MDGVRKDINRWIKSKRTLGDEWKRGRFYEMDGGGKNFTRKMEEEKTLQDE